MIAFIIESLDIRGGTHKQFLKLLNYTARITDEFIIITYKVDYTKTYPDFGKYKDKIHVITAGPPSFRHPFSIIKARKELHELLRDADVVNIHDCGLEPLFPALKDKKVVWQVNDLPPAFSLGASKRQKQNLKTWFLKRLYVNYSKYIDVFTVNVSKNRDRIRKVFSRDAEVLYCGIEPIGIHNDTDATLERFKADRINLLSSGVFFPYRNYETQVRVVKLLCAKGYDVKLDIIGSTSLSQVYADSIRRMISDEGLDDRINICGMVDEAEFRRLHQQADIFMFINIDQSWGLAVFEAMSGGIPVVVSNSVGATEILTNNEDSIFVNPTDENEIAGKIIALMTDPDRYRALSGISAKFHEKYTWDNAYSSKMFELLS